MKRFFYTPTAIEWLKAAAFTAVVLTPVLVQAQDDPSAPSNLKAVADYNKVTLTWQRDVVSDTLYKQGFEEAGFPQEGWSQTRTNTYDNLFSWFSFPTEEIKENVEGWESWIHSGERSAALFFDDAAPHTDGSSAVQNEWLVMPVKAGARYVQFYTYIDPKVLTWGEDEGFPDHYYVKVSHDGGKTWEVIWDARYDSNGSDGWQLVSLYLGDNADGEAIVAFQALSDTENTESGLYLSWVIDDVRLLDAGTTPAADPAHSPSVRPLGNRPTYRNFVPTGKKVARPYKPRKAPAPADCYNVYLDNKRIAKNLHSLTFTDTSDKTAGVHQYAVQAVSLSEDLTSPLAKIDVEIKKATLNPPSNVRVTYKQDEETGKYDVALTWDAPEGERKPIYYNAYANGALFGGWLEDTSVGQTGLSKGIYTYMVTAVYENPDGESEPVGDIVALGTRPTPYNLTADRSEDGTLNLAWTAPKPSENAVEKYVVFRGNDKIGETTATTLSEANAPEGSYDYSVKALYADGVLSVPATIQVEYGIKPNYRLPFEENFDGDMKPANWTVEKVDGRMKDNYLWRFDNWYELPVSGGGFSGNFASVNASATGFLNVFTTLDTPPLLRNSADGPYVTLEFDMDYAMSGKKSEAGVYYSYNAEDWGEIDGNLQGYIPAELADGETCRPQHKAYDVTKCFVDDVTPVYFAWKYNAKQAYHIAIDNVRIYNSTTVGINGITDNNASTNASGAVYNLNGQRVVNAKKGMAKGVYVQNGKKFVVK